MKGFMVVLVLAFAAGSVFADGLGVEFESSSTRFPLFPCLYGAGNATSGMSAAGAGALNTLFGAYSFQNDDLFGGIMTASMEAVGIGSFVVAMLNIFPGNNTEVSRTVNIGVGGGLFLAGVVFGAARGSRLYKNLHGVPAGAGDQRLDFAPAFSRDGGGGFSLGYRARF